MTPEQSAVEKMKLAALQGIPGPEVGDDTPIEPLQTTPPEALEPEEQAIQLPPHRKLALLDGDTLEETRRQGRAVPAKQLANLTFKVSTGNDTEDANVTKGEVRMLFNQMTHMNLALTAQREALLRAKVALEEARKGTLTEAEAIDALAAITAAKP